MEICFFCVAALLFQSKVCSDVEAQVDTHLAGFAGLYEPAAEAFHAKGIVCPPGKIAAPDGSFAVRQTEGECGVESAVESLSVRIGFIPISVPHSRIANTERHAL